MISLKSTTALLVIAALVAIGPLSLNMFLPALPTMRITFAVSMEDIQLTLTLYLIGFALAQLICGPLADRFGRKPVILIGLICFLVASIACTYSTSLEELLVFRVIQSFGACVGPVLGRTMIRDVYGATESASVLSYLTSIIALAPAVAPMLGALINEAFDWRAIFLALSIIAALIGAIYFFLLPETLPAEERQQIEIKEVFGNYSLLLKDRIFVAYLLCGCIGFSGIFTYMAAAPFVLMEYFGIPESIFGYYYIVVVIGYIVGSLLGGYASKRINPSNVLRLGYSFAVLGSLLAFVLPLMELRGLYFTLIPVTINAVALGIVIPQTTAGALKHHGEMAGTASSLLGFVQMIFAAAAATLFSFLHQGDEIAMMSQIGGLGIVSFLCYALLVPSSEKQVFSVKHS